MLSNPSHTSLRRLLIGLPIAVGVIVIAYAAIALASYSSRTTDHKSTTYPSVERLSVVTSTSDLNVVAEDRHDMRVTAIVRHGLWRPHVAWSLRDGRLSLSGTCASWATKAGVANCRTLFVVRVPLGTTIAATAKAGDVEASGARRPVTLRTTSGDVHARNLTGPLTLDASSGDVEVDSYRGALLDAHTRGGDVNVQTSRPARRVTVHATSGDVRVAVPAGAYRVTTHVGSGDQQIKIPNSPGATHAIEASTSSGDLTIERR